MPERKNSLTAACNIVGPDGSLVVKGDPIPPEWLDHPEFDADHLVASGGAKRKKG